MERITRLAVAVVGVCGLTAAAQGALTAYYTLDNFNAAAEADSGLKNRGEDGSTSDLSLYTGKSDATVVTGIIGSALHFQGQTLYYTANGSGNAADDLTGFPFTFSIWMSNIVNDATSDIAMSIFGDSTNQGFSLGVNGSEQVQVVRRVTTGGSTQSSLSPSPVAPLTSWHNLIGVVNAATGNAEIYLDGKKLTPTGDTGGVSFSANLNRVGIGNMIGLDRPTNAYVDDAGLFNEALGTVDAALINGLGRTAGTGLSWLDEARALNAAAVDTTSPIDGYTWKRVNGLTGAVGDWGGTAAGGDAFIVTGAGGAGIAVVPEPATAGLAVAAGALMLGRRRARRSA